MEVSIALTDKELKSLQDMIGEDKLLEGKGSSLEDIIHESRKIAIFDEGEHGVERTHTEVGDFKE